MRRRTDNRHRKGRGFRPAANVQARLRGNPTISYTVRIRLKLLHWLQLAYNMTVPVVHWLNISVQHDSALKAVRCSYGGWMVTAAAACTVDISGLLVVVSVL